MPVTVTSTIRQAEAANHIRDSIKSAESLLEGSCKNEFKECKEVLQSSFKFDGASNGESATCASANGFVRAAILAYSNHHNLVIRPEDVWFAILTQFSFYINGHAEEFRDKFVSHEGKEELEVVHIDDGADRYTADVRDFVLGKTGMTGMTGLIHKRIRDPDFLEWTSPSFTTTTEEDKIVAAIIMMGTLQKYFDYRFSTLCGLPSITLLGERSDWQALLDKLNKLDSYGKECGQLLRILYPVLSRFVQTFDEPASTKVSNFWSRIVNHNKGSGFDYITGWITAFCFWNTEGVRLYDDSSAGVAFEDPMYAKGPSKPVCLDGILYSRVDFEDIPAGYVKVPLKFDDQGDVFPVMLVAGSVGTAWSHKEQPDDRSRTHRLNTVQPVSGWWMFHRQEPKVSIEVRNIRELSDDSDGSIRTNGKRARDTSEAKKVIDPEAVTKPEEVTGVEEVIEGVQDTEAAETHGSPGDQGYWGYQGDSYRPRG